MRTHPSIQRLAYSILFALDKSHNLGLQPQSPGIHANEFYAAYFREGEEPTKYEPQIKYHVTSCAGHGLKVIYMTAGNDVEVELLSLLTAAAKNASISVTSRTMLLSQKGFEKDAEEMSALTADQRGLFSPTLPYPCLTLRCLTRGRLRTTLANEKWNE